MRQASVPPNPNAAPNQPGAHFRRESTHSLQGENAGRGGYQGGRGRGYNPNYNNQMGYPPNNQFRNGPGQGRGMPPAFQPQGRGMPYPNSPQPNRSPAPVSSMPNTPNMPPANMQPNMNMQTPPQYHYPPPMAPQHQQVQYPPPAHQQPRLHFKPAKKPKARREQDRSLELRRQSDLVRDQHASNIQRSQPDFSEQPADQIKLLRMHVVPIQSLDNSKHPSASSQPGNGPNTPSKDPNLIDLSPENGEFERLLTLKNQNYGYPPQQVDQYGRPINVPYGYNNMPYMGPQGGSGYGQQFVPPSFHQQSHSMSRSPSQPERPSSASQQNQPVVVSSGQQSQGASKPSNDFVKPRKSAAIQIKNAAGEVVDTSSFKQPASPAPATATATAPTPAPAAVPAASTPPVVASTPTPPPPSKPSTPSHTRTESQATPKTAKEIQDELKEKIKRATQQSAPEDDKPKAEEPKPAAEAPKAEAAPAKEEKPAEPAQSADPEEDEMERMIREMEEADAKREKEEEEHRKRREAEKAAAKAKEESDRKMNADEADRKLREQEREMERLEEEREKKREASEASGKSVSVAEALAMGRDGEEGSNVESVTDKLADMKIEGDKSGDKSAAGADKRAAKPAALNLTPLNTKPVEPPQPTPAMQSLKSARFLQVMEQDIYPEGIKSPNPAVNAAVVKKGKTFRYDAGFLLQFQKVFTEQPSIQFHQQVKTLIGDGDGNRSATRTPASGTARQGSRGGAGFPGGPFNAPPGRGISGGALPKPGSVNNIASFARPGAPFPGPGGMTRSASQRGMGPNSPRQSSRQTRGSRRNEAQAAKTMPLTAGQEVKPISITSSGWKPTSVGKGTQSGANASGGYLDPEMVQRKVKANLNKMTPEKFDRIADQILLIASQSKEEADGRTLRQVIQLTFEKATDEAHWASMYAKFCKRMLETMSPEVRDERIKDKNGNVVSGGNLFRKYLLNRCQEEFERGWSVNLPEPPEEDDGTKKSGEAAMLSDEYYQAAAAKRRGLGLVQFIGELFKLGMLTERIMHECVQKLVDYKGVPDEAEIESLCKLLRTIGANLDETEKGRPMMDAYFQRIQTMMDLPELQSRMKFMLMDVADLRKAGWVSKESNRGPKTLEEIRAETEAAQAAKAQENARSNQRGGGGGGRPPVGRGDARNFSAGYNQQTSNQVGMDDLRRLKGSINRTSSQNVTLGPTSMFSSRSNSGRRMGPGGSLGRTEDSNASSRAGTPPTRENSNAFRYVFCFFRS